ncbi:MAG: CRISPR-associated endonuclease Cas2 [Bacillota bacterium]|jgi:CRISPR-associated protein Cas2|nr:CRISPR-associated endonuclease Cas2 [Bacillota bacterium]
MLYRFMRVILFFDLPMVTNDELKAYRKFVKFLKKDGFIMLQKSVYTKLALNHTKVKSIISNVNKNIPKEGLISILVVTEKQFANITNILGDHTSDVLCSDERLVEL